MKDLSQQRFGKLTALEPTDERDSGSVIWACRCDCGRTAKVSARNLTNGHTKSCGCLSGDPVSQGEAFGALIAKERVGTSESGQSLWRCVCECGGEVIVEGAQLRYGVITSCGCGIEKRRRAGLTLGRVEGTCLDSLKRGIQKNNKSGVRGVFWDKRKGKWCAQIKFQGKNHFLGYFDELEDAAKARRKAEEELFDPILKRHSDGEQDTR